VDWKVSADTGDMSIVKVAADTNIVAIATAESISLEVVRFAMISSYRYDDISEFKTISKLVSHIKMITDTCHLLIIVNNSSI
jgi:hypothetical protein